MVECQTVSHHIVFVLCRYTLEQTNCSSLLGITGAQRSHDFPTHLSLSDLHLLPIEYDRSLARSRIDLVEAITRYKCESLVRRVPRWRRRALRLDS